MSRQFDRPGATSSTAVLPARASSRWACRKVVVFERGRHRMQVPQPCGDRHKNLVFLRPLTPCVGVRALCKDRLQPRPAVRDLLDTLAFRLKAVPLRTVDDTPPLHDLVAYGAAIRMRPTATSRSTSSCAFGRRTLATGRTL